MLIVQRIEMAVEYLPAEETVSGIDKQVIPVDVAEPAILLIQVLINGLSILIDGDWLTADCIRLLEIILTAESIGSTAGHLYFLIDEIDPALHEGDLLLGGQVVQSLHNQVLLVLQISGSIAEESQ